MKKESTKGYKRTDFVVVAVCTGYTPTYRTVYEKNGEYYYFFNGNVSKTHESRLIHKSKKISR